MNRARRPLIAGNWKMHHGGASGCQLAQRIAEGSIDFPAVDILVAPPFTALAAVASELEGQPVEVAAQTLHEQPRGAFTGEVSGPMIVECGARWVLVGHSERRHLFGEQDPLLVAKTEAALAVGLRPIFCLGETLSEREAGRTFQVIEKQLSAVLPLLRRTPGEITLAYEPVWAIGTGHNATPEQAEEVHAILRAHMMGVSQVLADRTRLLYGGSVKPDNAASLLTCPNVDGALVGGASLDAGQFLGIVRAAAAVAATSPSLSSS